MARNRHIAMSSPSTSATSTPLYRVFRGLKTTQIISIPSSSAAWRSTINDLRNIYLEERWKECESKCLHLVDTCETMPVIHGYLLFLIASCVEMHARNMHHYSAAKPKKMEDAAMWLERCEEALSNATSPTNEYEVVASADHTPQISGRVQPSVSNDLEMTPTPMMRQSTSTLRTYNNVRGVSACDENAKSVEGVTESITKIIDVDLRNPFHKESDPFLSISSTNTPQRDSLEKIQEWAMSLPRLTPSPLRIRKARQPSQVLHYAVLPSSLSSMSIVSGETDLEDEEAPNSQESSLRIQAKKEAWRAEIDRRIAHRMRRDEDNLFRRRDLNHPMERTTTDELDVDCEMSSPTGTPGSNGLQSRAIPRTLSEMIHDFLGNEGNRNMSAACLAPIPHSSSAKPLPLCPRPKKCETEDCRDDNPDSDRASLARLEHAWEKMASFNKVHLAVADTQSLPAVEKTWHQLSEEYHLKRSNEKRDLQAFQARVARFNHQLSSLSRSLQQNIFLLRQLARDIEHNRSSHMQGQRLPPSKSYWSFALSRGIIDEKADDYDEHRDKPAMRLNVGWAAPGTLLNETKGARIERLKRGCFQTVGLRNEKRGHKGDEWYSYLCSEAVGDIRGLQAA